VDETDNLIAGHGRLLAAKKLGIEEVPAIILSGLTKAQKKAYVIADNQLALNSGWDLDMLKLEIEGLNELEFDIDLLGFDDDFLDDLFNESKDISLQIEDAIEVVGKCNIAVSCMSCDMADVFNVIDKALTEFSNVAVQVINE
jgi:hypothetical protein